MKEMKINYGSGVVVIPEAILSRLNTAKKSDITVLLTLLANNGAKIGEIAEKCAVTEETAERAIAFWRGAGIISFEDENAAVPAPESKPQKTEKAAKSEKSEKADKPSKTQKRGKRADLGELPDYTTNEIVDMVENDRDIALMIDECERALGKIFRMGETAKIIALRDYLGLSADYIMALCEYCSRMGKNSVRYLETTAVSLYDDGITDTESLEEHLAAVEEKHKLENEIRALFGMNMSRALTTKEKRFIEAWIGFGYGIDIIKLAYEITVDKINEPSLNYANAILESWNSKELKTEEEIRAQLEADAQAKSEPPAGKSFDSEDFFEAALRRSYGIPPEGTESSKKRK